MFSKGKTVYAHCSVSLQLCVRQPRLAKPIGIGIANSAVVLRQRILRRKVRRRRLRVKSVIVERIDHVEASMRCVDADHWVVNRVGHRDIEGPIPVRDTKCISCCLIGAALAGRVGGGDLLGNARENLL